MEVLETVLAAVLMLESLAISSLKEAGSAGAELAPGSLFISSSSSEESLSSGFTIFVGMVAEGDR